MTFATHEVLLLVAFLLSLVINVLYLCDPLHPATLQLRRVCHKIYLTLAPPRHTRPAVKLGWDCLKSAGVALTVWFVSLLLSLSVTHWRNTYKEW